MDAGSQFRFHVFDPALIVLQIVAVQLLYYFALAVIVHLVAVGADAPLSLSLLFSGEAVKRWQIKTAYFIACPVAGALLGYIVGRAKQCLDFAATIHVVHLGVTTLVTGFPRSASWWIINAACVALTSSAGEYICININLGSIRIKGPARKGARDRFKARHSDVHTARGD